jgi:hypothetical protein
MNNYIMEGTHHNTIDDLGVHLYPLALLLVAASSSDYRLRVAVEQIIELNLDQFNKV